MARMAFSFASKPARIFLRVNGADILTKFSWVKVKRTFMANVEIPAGIKEVFIRAEKENEGDIALKEAPIGTLRVGDKTYYALALEAEEDRDEEDEFFDAQELEDSLIPQHEEKEVKESSFPQKEKRTTSGTKPKMKLDNKVTIPKLMQGKEQDWCFEMEEILPFIEEEEALPHLLIAIKGHPLAKALTLNASSTPEVLKAIRERYADEKSMNKEWISLKQKEDETLENFVARCAVLAEKNKVKDDKEIFEKVADSVSAVHTFHVRMCGNWKSLLENARYINAPKPEQKKEKVFPIQDEEEDDESELQEETEVSQVKTKEASASNGTYRKKIVVCYFCNKPGHIAKFCKLRLAQEGRKQ